MKLHDVIPYKNDEDNLELSSSFKVMANGKAVRKSFNELRNMLKQIARDESDLDMMIKTILKGGLFTINLGGTLLKIRKYDSPETITAKERDLK